MRRLFAIVVVVVLGLLPVAPAGAEDRAFEVPASACVATGDSAPAIEAFLATVPNDSVVLFPKNAMCQVERTVDLGIPAPAQPKRDHTTIDLNGATIFRMTEPACTKIDECNGPVVALNLVNGVTLQGGAIRGGQHVEGLPEFDATREHDHGIAVHGSLNVTLFGLHISDVAGDCVDVDKQKKDVAANIRVIGTSGRPFVCEGAGRQGVSGNAVTDLRIQGLQFDRIASTAIDLEPRHHGYIDTALVLDNAFGWVGNYAIAGIGGGDTWKDVTVQNNVQTDPDHPGDAFLRAGNSFDRGPLTIEDNRIRSRIQLNHITGSAAGNVLLPGHRTKCMFELFNDPPFEVADSNTHPASTELTCSLEGKIANGGIVGTARKLKKYLLPAVVVLVLLLGLAVWLFVRWRRRRSSAASGHGPAGARGPHHPPESGQAATGALTAGGAGVAAGAGGSAGPGGVAGGGGSAGGRTLAAVPNDDPARAKAPPPPDAKAEGEASSEEEAPEASEPVEVEGALFGDDPPVAPEPSSRPDSSPDGSSSPSSP